VVAIAATVVSVPTAVLANELEKLLPDINVLEQNGDDRDAIPLARKHIAEAETTPDRSAAVVGLTRRGYATLRGSSEIKWWDMERKRE
jgi:hypothetical protein